MEKNKARGILGVRPGVSLQELTTAYRKAALKRHPDRPGGSNEKFQELDEAFDTLKSEMLSSKPEEVRSKFQSFNKPTSNKFEEFQEELNKFQEDLRKEQEEIDEKIKANDKKIKEAEAIARINEELILAGVSISDLDPSIWAPYSDWKEKLRDPGIFSNYNYYVDYFLCDMRIAINRAKWDKINANDDYNNDYSNQNYTEKNNKNWQGYSEKDNFRHEKNGKEWEGEYNGSKKTTFNSSDDYIRELEEKIESHRNELAQTSSDEKRKYLWETIEILKNEIKKLRNNVNSNNEQDKDNKKNDLSAYRERVRNSISEALNTDPQLTNNDLESSFQNWENKLTKLKNKTDITDFQTSLLLHIENIRETKQEEQENTQNFNKFNNPNATEEEKEEALEDIEKNEGQQSYEKDRDKIEKAKKELAKKNATKYRNRVITKLTSKLTKYEVQENELDNQTRQEIQHLKNGEITQPEKLVETEIRIIQKIGEKGAEKKITYFTQEVETVLKTNDDEKKESLKINLMDFIASKNVYYQTQKAQAETLLNRLQNNTQDQNNTASNFPYGVVIPLSLLGLVLVGILVIAFRKKSYKKVNFRKF